MTSVTANNRFDEIVTSEVLTQAIQRGRMRASAGVHASGVQYVPVLKALLISFADHSAVALPIQNYPELARLNEEELNGLELGFAGSALCLETRDLHVSISGLMSASQPLMEMAASLIAARNGGRSSSVKAQAARANGQKGGRPRLALTP
jgi:hypothetical protein